MDFESVDRVHSYGSENQNQHQDRRVASRQTRYFFCKRQKKVTKKWLSPRGGHDMSDLGDQQSLTTPAQLRGNFDGALPLGPVVFVTKYSVSDKVCRFPATTYGL
jgi:hypothetical protein